MGEFLVWQCRAHFPICQPSLLTLALGVPAQHLLLVGELNHLQDLPTSDPQVLPTPTPCLGIGVNHHLCLNHDLALKLGRGMLELWLC